MIQQFRAHSVIVGLLFIVTMLLGMADAYFVAPALSLPGSSGVSPALLELGIFCVSFMAIGIVGIAATLFPVVRRQNEVIATTYLAFRVVEGVLLLLGAVLYLFLLSSPDPGTNTAGLLRTVSSVKLSAYQLSMMILGMGSLLLNASFFQSRLIPRWLSIWGLVGYACLFVSAVMALLGVVDPTKGAGALLYLPGGLWELLVFPGWVLVKGFDAPVNLEV